MDRYPFRLRVDAQPAMPTSVRMRAQADSTWSICSAVSEALTVKRISARFFGVAGAQKTEPKTSFSSSASRRRLYIGFQPGFQRQDLRIAVIDVVAEIVQPGPQDRMVLVQPGPPPFLRFDDVQGRFEAGNLMAQDGCAEDHRIGFIPEELMYDGPIR